MKTIWKRTMSLALSGVLLFGSVPVQAWATEGTTAEPTVAATVPVADLPQVTEPVMLQEDTPETYPIMIGDNQLDENEKVSEQYTFDGTNKLTLKDKAKLASVHFTDTEKELIIEVPADVTAEITGILEATNGIQITGEGTLTVGQINAGKNLSVKDTLVQIGSDKEEGKDALTLISVEDTIEISGKAHVITAEGHKAVTFNPKALEGTEGSENTEEPKCKIICAGYYRTDSGFVTVEKDAELAKTLGFFEAVSAEHLSEKLASNDTHHYKTCEEGCPMGKDTQVASEEHGAEQETEQDDNNTHTTTLKCCGRVVEDKVPHELTYTADADNAVITAECEPCGATGTLTLNVANAEYGSTASNVEIVAEGILEGEENNAAITYKDAEENEVTPPLEIGKYTVDLTYGRVAVSKQFDITKINLENATVTVSGEYVYNGEAHKPAVDDITVTLGESQLEYETHYTVSYGENINAGEGTVIITAVESSIYEGQATGEFDIAPKKLDVSDLEITNTELTYNGKKQAPNVAKKNENSDVDFEPVDAETVNAGTYTLTIQGKGNYCGTVEVSYTIARAEVELVVENQTVTKGGDFVEPKFLLGDEEVEGTYRYTVNDSQEKLSYDGVKAALNAAGTYTIKFEFTPDADNYTFKDSDELEFTVTVKTVEFKPGTGEESFKDGDFVTSTKWTYGDNNALKLDAIKAYANGEKVDPENAYTVTFMKGGAAEDTRPLPVGEYSFVITYTGNIDGVAFKDHVVYESTEKIKVEAKKIVITTGYTAKNLTIEKDSSGNPKAQALLTGEAQTNVADASAYEWVYQVEGDTEATTSIPKKAEADLYKITYYAKSKNPNYTDSDEKDATVLILPELEAEYGKQLKDIDLKGTGFEWVDGTKKVGNVYDSAKDRTFKLKHTKTGEKIDVVVTVNPIKVKVDVTLEDKYLKYNSGAKVEAKVTVKKHGTSTVIPAAEYTAVCTNITNTADTVVKNPGKAKVTVASKGNYEFQNTEAELTKEYVVYWSAGLALTETWKFEDYGNKDMKVAGYADGKKVKTEVDKKLDKEKYPETLRKYYNFAMKEPKTATTVSYVYHAFYWPDDGITFELPYATNVTKNDKFKVYGMYTVNSGTERTDLNTKAGTVFEIKEATGTTLGINEFKKTDTGISLRLKNYAVVCVAAEENAEKEYTITASSNSTTKGTVGFKVGSSTTAKTSSKAKKGDVITVITSPKSGYELTRLNYTYNNGTKDVTEAINKNSDGKYTFKMPSANVKIKAQFDKKTTNPSSGDTSNIHMWMTVLGVSGLALVALIAFWIWKRRK